MPIGFDSGSPAKLYADNYRRKKKEDEDIHFGRLMQAGSAVLKMYGDDEASKFKETIIFFGERLKKF